MPSTNNRGRTILEIIGIAVIAFAIFGIIRNERRSYQNDIQALKKTYDDSVSYYVDALSNIVASKEVVEIEFYQLKELDSAKYSELQSRYEARLRQVAGSSTASINHAPVEGIKITEPITTEEYGSLGLIEHQDSCIAIGFNFTDSGTYVNYLLASYDITSTILLKDGKIINDVNLNTPCGQIAQVKTFVFAPEPKKWFQKPLVVGGIGLGAGLITGIILSR